MKLKQYLTIDGVTTTQINTGDLFGHLFNAQFQLSTQRPDLGEHWLQAHPLLPQMLPILAHIGKLEIFSLEHKLHLSIRWEWVKDEDIARELLPKPALQHEELLQQVCQTPWAIIADADRYDAIDDEPAVHFQRFGNCDLRVCSHDGAPFECFVLVGGIYYQVTLDDMRAMWRLVTSNTETPF